MGRAVSYSPTLRDQDQATDDFGTSGSLWQIAPGIWWKRPEKLVTTMPCVDTGQKQPSGIREPFGQDRAFNSSASCGVGPFFG
jgi:hypothetical protein